MGVDETLRAAMRAAAAASAAKAEAEEGVRAERASRVAKYAGRKEEIRRELVAAGERTIELLLNAPNRGGIESVLVDDRGFGRRSSVEGWMVRGEGKEHLVFLPSREVVNFIPSNDKVPASLNSRASLISFVDLHLRYVMTEAGYDTYVEASEWSSPGSRHYGQADLEEGLHSSLEGRRSWVIGVYVALLRKAGVAL
jgi:hypothetical protein